MYSYSIQNQAFLLRKKGYSFSEISKFLHISKSTASLWVRHMPLTIESKKRLIFLKDEGRKKGLEKLQRKRAMLAENISQHSLQLVQKLPFNSDFAKYSCALLYWGEGGKSDTSVKFINSDSNMIRTFLILFRKAFEVDEKKFRIQLHLHEYHNVSKLIRYWCEITGIPEEKCTKPYIKPHTGKIVRVGYMGCVRISYYDKRILDELLAVYSQFSSWLFTQHQVQ